VPKSFVQEAKGRVWAILTKTMPFGYDMALKELWLGSDIRSVQKLGVSPPN